MDYLLKKINHRGEENYRQNKQIIMYDTKMWSW